MGELWVVESVFFTLNIFFSPEVGLKEALLQWRKPRRGDVKILIKEGANPEDLIITEKEISVPGIVTS